MNGGRRHECTIVAFIAPQALLMRLPLVGPLAFIPMQVPQPHEPDMPLVLSCYTQVLATQILAALIKLEIESPRCGITHIEYLENRTCGRQ